MNSKKGYSLIEIVIGLVVITLFLVTTGSLVNAAYTNYRLVLQRNEALDYAINRMENILKQPGDMGLSLATTDRVYTEEEVIKEGIMKVTTTVDKVKKEDNTSYSDKLLIVTVDVQYKKASSDTKEYHLKLESLKVVK